MICSIQDLKDLTVLKNRNSEELREKFSNPLITTMRLESVGLQVSLGVKLEKS